MLTAVVLCGGQGRRIASVAAGTPKVLLPIGSRPFLWYLLQHLGRQGVGSVVLSTGHLGDQVETYIRCGRWPVPVRCVREARPLGTGGALRLAADTLEHRGPLLVLNGDTFFGGLPSALKLFHDARADARGSLALTHMPDARRFGRVEVHGRTGAVERFAEKSRTDAQPAWISAGMYILEPALVRSIPPGRTVSLEQEVFPAWIGRGLYGCRMAEARLLDFGTPEDYARAQDLVHDFYDHADL